ncbi:hypothetical protein BIW11_02719 [Tropilaelaps mercedesae]|uniref:Uncharacterized protein n=1 Tax=Tropilaelaps mercedesae TaxID=418985 RepID=A0A1V9XYD1_9ACAR|nr:hypothetical protein BIW11_02719 [Tropilaelaps mercedesae]
MWDSRLGTRNSNAQFNPAPLLHQTDQSSKARIVQESLTDELGSRSRMNLLLHRLILWNASWTACCSQSQDPGFLDVGGKGSREKNVSQDPSQRELLMGVRQRERRKDRHLNTRNSRGNVSFVTQTNFSMDEILKTHVKALLVFTLEKHYETPSSCGVHTDTILVLRSSFDFGRELVPFVGRMRHRRPFRSFISNLANLTPTGASLLLSHTLTSRLRLLL